MEHARRVAAGDRCHPGRAPMVGHLVRDDRSRAPLEWRHRDARAVALVLLVLAGLIVATWKQLVQSFYIGLTGREWLIKGSGLLALTLLFFLGPIVQWIIDTPGVQRALLNALPLILAGLVGVKMS